MDNKSRDVALHRYVLIREAADPALKPAERGELVRSLASVEHLGPEGSYARVSRPTLDRWIRAWRAGGFDALMPKNRKGVPVVPRELLDLAEDLKREAPKRTGVQIAEIIKAARGTSPSARTIQRHFAMLGLNRTPDGRPPKAFGRFEALAPNDLWTGDALHGPVVTARKTYLFAYIDDHSRLLPGYRWGYAEEHAPPGGGAARRPRRPRSAPRDVRRQRERVCLPVAGAGLRGAGDPPSAQQARRASW